MLTQEYIKNKLDYINSEDSRKQKLDEYNKFLVYNGKIRGLLEDAIRKEFKKPETLNELFNRLLPLNIARKVIDRLAKVYETNPVREPIDGSEFDKEAIDYYEDVLDINRIGKLANRDYKLWKKALIEMYIDDSGYPRLRTLPAHTYYAFSDSLVSPTVPDSIFKIVRNDKDPAKSIYQVWSEDTFVVVNGRAEIMRDYMIQLNNPDMINPYGVLPFIYLVDSQIDIEPIQDDDLVAVSLAVPVLLTDTAFGIKYQSWSLVYTIGLNQGDLPSGANSVINLPFGPEGQKPEIGHLKTEVNIDGVLKYVESIVSILLSSKGLRSSAISTNLSPDASASGIAKMIDNAELVEERKEQYGVFYKFEHDLWFKMSKILIPYWQESGKLNLSIPVTFSDTFDISVQFKEPSVSITDKEKIELSKMRLDAGLSTKLMELKTIYPDKTEEELQNILLEIESQKPAQVAAIATEMEDDGTESTVQD